MGLWCGEHFSPSQLYKVLTSGGSFSLGSLCGLHPTISEAWEDFLPYPVTRTWAYGLCANPMLETKTGLILFFRRSDTNTWGQVKAPQAGCSMQSSTVGKTPNRLPSGGLFWNQSWLSSGSSLFPSLILPISYNFCKLWDILITSPFLLKLIGLPYFCLQSRSFPKHIFILSLRSSKPYWLLL